MPMKRIIVLAILVFVFAGAYPAAAVPVMIHNSTEEYYSSGGTSVVDLTNLGNSFTVGNTSGTVLWEVNEKVWQDADAGTTLFAYTVHNDLLTSPITSFSLLNNAAQPLSFTAPTNWSFVSTATTWTWSTANPANGIAEFAATNTMDVTLQGLVPVGFAPNTTIIAGTTQSSPDWVVSTPTPEPGTLFLIGTGLAVAGTWGRKVFFAGQGSQEVA
jgi:hypothetical protein